MYNAVKTIIAMLYARMSLMECELRTYVELGFLTQPLLIRLVSRTRPSLDAIIAQSQRISFAIIATQR